MQQFLPQVPELKFLRRGKVRDLYEVDSDHLLMVASDRISAFDCVLPNPIPYKGAVLTQLSQFWFGKLASIVPHHFVTSCLEEFPAALQSRLSSSSKKYLSRRSMLVRRADIIPFECVVRGYLAGSGWKEYQATGEICGHRLPPGLIESAKLPEPIFTPATKAEEGHDINITVSKMSSMLGQKITADLERLSLALYQAATAHAETKGIIICDTKFEFGVRNGEILLVDEVLTPDSSRFWAINKYQAGSPQPSFDKQYVRDYLETLLWDKCPPAPSLPVGVITATSQKYLEVFRLITGSDLATDE